MFLDRDGTINVRPAAHDYIRDSEEFKWLPGALQGMLMLAKAGLPLVIVSNQRGISLGVVTHTTLHEIECRIQAALGAHGHEVAAFRYCPHGLDEACDCRKPLPGLLCAAARDLRLDLSQSWMIGDADTDVDAGLAAGCRTIRLTTEAHPPQQTATSLLEAAEIILEHGGGG